MKVLQSEILCTKREGERGRSRRLQWAEQSVPKELRQTLCFFLCLVATLCMYVFKYNCGISLLGLDAPSDPINED